MHKYSTFNNNKTLPTSHKSNPSLLSDTPLLYKPDVSNIGAPLIIDTSHRYFMSLNKRNLEKMSLLFGGSYRSSELDKSVYELNLFRSFSNKTIIDIEFNKSNSSLKKPRYFLTLRQKPLKSWYSYVGDSGFFYKNSGTYNSIKSTLSSSIFLNKNGFYLSNSNRLLNTTTVLVLPINKPISIISNSFDVVHS